MRQPPEDGPRAVECTAMKHFRPLAASLKAWTASWPSKAGCSNRGMKPAYRESAGRDAFADAPLRSMGEVTTLPRVSTRRPGRITRWRRVADRFPVKGLPRPVNERPVVIANARIGLIVMHALIIEDDPFSGFQLQTLLKTIGFLSFDCASTQTQAVVACRGRRPDLITADVQLCEGNGMGAVDEIAREFGAIPAVFVTGYPERLVGRPDPVCRKPLEESAFCHTVAQMLAV